LNRLRATVFVIQLSRRLFQIVKPIVFVFSTFTAGKFGKMVYHNDWKELHQEVSRECLPKHIGGTEFSVQEALEIFTKQCNGDIPDKYSYR
jgi:hypothetical protein